MTHPVGATLADPGLHDDQRGAIGLGAGGGERQVERDEIGSVIHMLNVPLIPEESIALVRGRAQVGASLDGDSVVVEDPDELAELLVPRQRGHLVGNALHEISVRAERVRVVVHHVVAGAVEAHGQPALGERHPNGVRDALAERSGRGLDAGRVPQLGMPRRERSPLPEVHNLLHRQVVARQDEGANR